MNNRFIQPFCARAAALALLMPVPLCGVAADGNKPSTVGDTVLYEDFESGLKGWQLSSPKDGVDPWKIEPGIGRPVDVATPPTSCLVWERKAGDPSPRGIRRIVPVKPGQVLEITVATLMETDPKLFTKGPMFAVCVGNAKKELRWSSSNRYAEHNVRDVHGWHTLTLTIPAIPADADRIQVCLCVDPKSVGRFRFDDLQIRLTETKTVDRFACSARGWRAAEGEVLFSGVVCVDPEICAKKDLVVRLSGAGKSWPMKMDAENVAETVVAASDLPMGETRLRLTAETRDGKTLGAAEHAFVRTEVLPMEKRPKVHFDIHRRLVVDGKPIFPLATSILEKYIDDPQAMELLKSSPFNIVLSGAKDPKRATLDKLAATGKWIISRVDRAYVFPPEVRARPLSWIKTEADAEAFVRRKVQEVKDHPAHLCWTMADELPIAMVPRIEARDRLLRELDPEHPTQVCQIGAHGVRDFSACADCIEMDNYPVGGLSASEEEKVHPNMASFVDICRSGRRQGGAHKPLWPVLQAFNWQGDYPNETYPWMRFPNFAECRAQAWLCLAEGADGFKYFTFSSVYKAWKKGDRQPYEDLIRSIEEVKRLSDVLLSVEPEPKVSGVTDQIAVRAISHQGSQYVIVCNKTWQPVSGELKLSGAWAKATAEVGEACALKDASTLSYALPPIGVSVMRLDNK